MLRLHVHSEFLSSMPVTISSCYLLAYVLYGHCVMKSSQHPNEETEAQKLPQVHNGCWLVKLKSKSSQPSSRLQSQAPHHPAVLLLTMESTQGCSADGLADAQCSDRQKKKKKIVTWLSRRQGDKVVFIQLILLWDKIWQILLEIRLKVQKTREQLLARVGESKKAAWTRVTQAWPYIIKICKDLQRWGTK